MIWGLLALGFGLSTIGPLLFALHLSTSPTVAPSRSNVAVKAADLLSTIIAIVCGYLLPTILIGLPAPSLISYEIKQLFSALWQAFPIWTFIVQIMSKSALERFSHTNAAIFTGLHVHRHMAVLRFTYSFLILVAGLTHIHACTLSLTASLLPQMFAPSAVKALHYSSVFIPKSNSPSTKVQDAASGAALFLQWDEIVGLSAFFLWTLPLYLRAKHQRGQLFTPSLFLQLLLGTIVAGPVTGAVALMWARDELLMGFQDMEPKAGEALRHVYEGNTKEAKVSISAGHG